MVVPRFPPNAVNEHGSFYAGAAVCRRGHVETDYIKPDTYRLESMCTQCGARVLVGCLNCGLRIRGDYFVPGYVGPSNYSPPSFCDGCGAAFPWATREERIFELENLLDEQDIDEADRVFVSDRLRELREQDYFDEKRERQIWTQIGQRTGSFLTSERAGAIVQSLVTTAVRKAIGWE